MDTFKFHRILLALLFVCGTGTAMAQVANYADAGNGLHRDDILWFTWAGTDLDDGVHNDDQVIFNMPHGGTVQLDFSNVSVNYPIPDPTPGDGETPDGYRPSDMKVWCGATLYTAYNISGSSSEALISDMSAAGVLGDGENGQDIKFDLTYSVTINGVTVPADIIVGDPETTNPAASFQEQLKYTTNANDWGLVENIRGSNYGLTGLGTADATITDTESGVACSGGVNSGTNSSPLLLSKGKSGTTTKLTLETIFPHGDGHQGFALGLLMPVDQSDAPLSYTVASHIQHMSAPFSGPPALNNDQRLHLGAVAGDTDNYLNLPGLLGSNANGDDTDDVNDEDGLSNTDHTFSSAFGGTLRIPLGEIDLHNSTGGSATLHAWIDFDQDGAFGADEYTSADVGDARIHPNTDLVFTTPGDAVTGTTLVRLRLTSDGSLDANTPGGIALDGEVEDHRITLGNVCTDNSLLDTDADGINNICDLDDDNDGLRDEDETGFVLGEHVVVNGVTGPLDLDLQNAVQPIEIIGLPNDAVLSAGTKRPDGTWVVEAANVPGLTVTTSTIGNHTISVTQTVDENSITFANMGTFGTLEQPVAAGGRIAAVDQLGTASQYTFEPGPELDVPNYDLPIIEPGEFGIISDVDAIERFAFPGAPTPYNGVGVYEPILDRTAPGTGYYAFYDLSPASQGSAIFQETVTGLVPNAPYQFSAYMANTFSDNIPSFPNDVDMVIGIEIDNVEVINSGVIPPVQSSWVRYSGIFNTNASGTVNVAFINRSTGGFVGADLAIDDISLAQLITNQCVLSVVPDTDEDGVPDHLDLDSDNDGIYDVVESGSEEAFTNGVLNGAVTTSGIPVSVDADANDALDYSISDSDSDGNFDSVELDSDDDLCYDVLEAGYIDHNDDGELGDVPLTVDGDGLVTSGGP